MVVVAGNGGPMVEVLWKIPLEFEEVFVSQNMSDRIHQEPMKYVPNVVVFQMRVKL